MENTLKEEDDQDLDFRLGSSAPDNNSVWPPRCMLFLQIMSVVKSSADMQTHTLIFLYKQAVFKP